MKSKAENQL